MKTQIPKEYWKSQGPPLLISYKPDPTIRNTTTDKSDSLKVDIKTQPGESNNETVEIYVTLFWKESPESLLKFVIIIHKIIRGQDLSTGPKSLGLCITWLSDNPCECSNRRLEKGGQKQMKTMSW